MILLIPYIAVSLTKDFIFAICYQKPPRQPSPEGRELVRYGGTRIIYFLLLFREFEYSNFRDLPFAYRLPPLGEGWGGGLYPKNT